MQGDSKTRQTHEPECSAEELLLLVPVERTLQESSDYPWPCGD
jgi:hypothetical protein